jgi:cell division protease FtsH
MSLPQHDKYYMSRKEMLDELVVLLGGRVAEQIVLDDISTGASNDIERATALARSMVTKYGMSDKLGPINYGGGQNEVFLGRDFATPKSVSEETQSVIDAEVKRIIDEAYLRCQTMIQENREILDRIAAFLLEHETMDGSQFEAVFKGETPDTEMKPMGIAVADEEEAPAPASEAEAAPETPAETEPNA